MRQVRNSSLTQRPMPSKLSLANARATLKGGILTPINTNRSRTPVGSVNPTSVVAESSSCGGIRSSSWSKEDDELLVQARAQGLNWNQIAPKHFPLKSANACRKRHERLMERMNAEQWHGVKLEILAQAYMEVRREMWSILAARVGEKWQLIEQKCMEKGIRNLTQACRYAQKKQADASRHDHDDSGIGISDLDEDCTVASQTQSSDYQSRVSSIQSMLPPPLRFENSLHTSVAKESKSHNSVYGEDTPHTVEYAVIDHEHNEPGFLTANSRLNTGSDTNGGKSIVVPRDSTTLLTELYLPQKSAIVDRLMTRFEDVLKSAKFLGRQRHGDSETPTRGSQRSVGDVSKTSGKTKRRSSDREDEEHDENAERARKRQRKDDEPSRSRQAQISKKNFACPYFKHDVFRYGNQRSCRGPVGWDTIPRLKEHLYRQHTLLPQCSRCQATFKDEKKLEAHRNPPEMCTLRKQAPSDSLNEIQLDQLKDRKSMFRAASDEEKWKHIYLIIFPDSTPDDIPTPYYDDEMVDQEMNGGSSAAPAFAQYEAYMSREFPRKVRKELLIAIEKLTGPIEETLKNQMENLIRNCHERLSRDFFSNKSTPSKTPEKCSMIAESITSISCVAENTEAVTSNMDSRAADADSSYTSVPRIATPDTSNNYSTITGGPSDVNCPTVSNIEPLFDFSTTLPSDLWWIPPDSGLLQQQDLWAS